MKQKLYKCCSNRRRVNFEELRLQSIASAFACRYWKKVEVLTNTGAHDWAPDQ